MVAADAFQAGASSGQPTQYTVQPGDSMWKISVRFHVTLAALEKANPQCKRPALIHPGQVLTIPPAPGATAPPPPPPSTSPTPTPTSGLLPSELAVYNTLTPAQQQQYAAAWSASGEDGFGNLAALLGQAKLTQTDAQGNTLLSDLAAMATLTPPEGATYTAADVLDSTLWHLADPDVIQQSDHNTCPATVIEHYLAIRDPAEYARIVVGLAGHDGVVTLRSGSQLTRVPDSVSSSDGKDARDNVERLMQAALMNHEADIRGSYSDRADRFDHSADVPVANAIGQVAEQTTHIPGVAWLVSHAPELADGISNKLDAAHGLSESETQKLYQDVFGKQATLIGDLPSPAADFLDTSQQENVYNQVVAAVQSGKPVMADIFVKNFQDQPGGDTPVMYVQVGKHRRRPMKQSDVSYSEKMNSHELLIERIDGDRVYYWNPWGYQSSMPLEEFKLRVTDAIILDNEPPLPRPPLDPAPPLMPPRPIHGPF